VKKILWGGVVLGVLLVAAALVGPGLIDWNNYKTEIAAQVKSATGRDLSINGDIRITVLPAPAVLASDVTLSNAKGASSTDMVSLKSAEVRIALAPLLGGQVKVETVKLVEPVINLEVLADGSKNWDLQASEAPEQQAGSSGGDAGAPTDGGASQSPAVILENFTIENGTVIYLDNTTGFSERIDVINAEIAAASLKGPFQVQGSMTARNIPLTYDVNVGEIIQGRTLTLNVKTGIAPDLANLQINGTVLGLPEEPRFKGNIRGGGANLVRALGVAGISDMPPILAQTFAIEGAVSGSAKGGDIKDLNLSVADSKIGGDVAVDLGEKTNFAVRLAASQFDIDKWLTASTPTASSAAPRLKAAKVASAAVPKPKASQQGKAPTGFQIPTDLGGSLIISVDAVKYRGGLIRDVLMNTDVTKGQVTLSQLSAQFPGGSDMALFGTLSADQGKPNFVGEVETTVNDLRGVLSWLGTDLGGVPTDRLRKLSLSTQLNVTPDQAQVTGLDFRFDNSRLTGAATIALRKRPSFGVNATLDRINLDAYLPKDGIDKKAATPAPKQQKSGSASSETANASAPEKAKSPFKGLSVLGTFDANIQARVKSLVYQGEQIRDASIDATLYNSNLDIRRIAVARLAGASASLAGQLSDLTGLPKAKGLKVKMASKNLAPLIRYSGVDLGLDAKKLGAFSADATVDGNLLKPSLKALVKTAGATVNVAGKLSVLPITDMFDLNVSARHKDLARLARAFGSTYRPSGKLGGLDFSLRATGNPGLVNLNDIKGKIGTITLGGDATVRLDGTKPHVKANLNTGIVAIDPFLPAPKKAFLDNGKWGPLRVQPVVWLGSRLKGTNPALHMAAKKGRWPADPIDLSVLNAVNADLKLNAPAIIFGKYLIEKADVSASIKDGVLTADRLTGMVFGGTLNAALRAAAGSTNQVGGKIKVNGIRIADALRAVVGEASADGQLSIDLDVNAGGRSVADLVSTLGGVGAFNMTNVDVSKQAKGSIFAGVYGLVSALNQFGASKGSQRADVSGSFKINNGVAQTNDLKLASGLGNGGATGTVDLPNWKLNINGEVKLVQSALTQLLQARLRQAKGSVPFSVTGSLDQPDVNVDMGAAMGSAVPIPGADLLLNKAPKGLGSLLKGVLGGGSQEPTSPPSTGTTSGAGDTPPPPRNTQQPSQQQLNPADLLKQLLK